MTLLETQNLNKSFGGMLVVNSVELSVDEGEIRGLIGPNGSGKTTLINLISGIYLADAGQVTFQGRPILGLPADEIARCGLLRTFQIPKLFGNMSVLDNMLIPYYARANPISGGDVAAARKRADQLLRLADLFHLRDSLARILSGGQQSLLQIARGFMVDNIFLYLLDEPFAGVNPVIKEAINRLIRKANEEDGVSFVLISHEMEQIRKLCHRVSVLAAGIVIAEGTLEVVAEDAEVIDAYLGGQ